MDVENGVQVMPDDQAPDHRRPSKASTVDYVMSSGSQQHPASSSLQGKLAGPIGFILGATALIIGSIALSKVNQVSSSANEGIVDAPSTLLSGGPSTLFQIQQRGKLNCGITITPGFGEETSNGYKGFDVDLCRAVGAAIFGHAENPDDNVVYTVLTATQRFGALQNKEVDMLARITTHTMDRDVYIPQIETGLSFSEPYFYDGHKFAGDPHFVDCATSQNVEAGCSDLLVCVHDGTTTLHQLQQLLPADNILVGESNQAVQGAFVAGECNVIFAGTNAVAEVALVEAGHSDTYTVGNELFSHEPLALVTRQDDDAFTDFVNWILQAIFNAQEQGVTRNNYDQIPEVSLFGDDYAMAFRNAIRTVGNYDEIYTRNLALLLGDNQNTLNSINEGKTGRILAQEFGNLDADGPLFHQISTLDRVKRRGHVSCGVSHRAGFAEFDASSNTWSGLDVDMCRALSAAIFDGDSSHVVYHSLVASDRFEALSSGMVDLLARLTTHTFTRDVLEPTSGYGFTFTQPFFYDGLSFGGLGEFAACADRLDTTSSQCRDLKVCVNDGTTTLARVNELFPAENIVVLPSGQSAQGGLATGECNALAAETHGLSRESILSVAHVEDHHIENYSVGSNRFSKEPLAMVTRQGDPTWSDFVYWTLEALFNAEEEGITRATAATEMPTTNLFGPLYRDMLKNAVQAVGNYNEVYIRNMEAILPRGGLNLLNSQSGPQIFPLPGLALKN